MKKGLFALALGTFTLGMTEFIIEGIITDVAHNMNVSIPEAGHLISIYALGVCAGAFSLILMHKYRPKKILMFLASIITIGAIIASVAPNLLAVALRPIHSGFASWCLLRNGYHRGSEDGKGGKGNQGGGYDVRRYAGSQSGGRTYRHLPESCVQLASTLCQLHIARYHDDVYDSQMGSRRGCVAE